MLQADIRQAHQVETMVEHMVVAYGHLDAMVCNAGIASGNLLLRLPVRNGTRSLGPTSPEHFIASKPQAGTC